MHVGHGTRAFICIALSILAAACSGVGDTTVGGRPLIYKNSPGDEVETRAGVARKVDNTAEPAPRPVPAQPPARRESAPVIAQARPAARPSAAAAPEGDFAARYTQASRYGDLLFVSGQIANDPRTGAFDSTQDIDAQTRRVLENVRAVLEANRLTMANVVSVTVCITNISRLSGMDAAYHEFFRGDPPARTVVEVSHLPRGALVEISVVAGR